MEDYYLGLASERIFLPMIRQTLPEIVDMHFPAEGIFHNLVLVSIDKRYPGHARKIMNAFWGLGQLMFSKTIVVVDKDVNVDLNQVAWIVGLWIRSAISDDGGRSTIWTMRRICRRMAERWGSTRRRSGRPRATREPGPRAWSTGPPAGCDRDSHCAGADGKSWPSATIAVFRSGSSARLPSIPRPTRLKRINAPPDRRASWS
jgi:hypothetical protein